MNKLNIHNLIKLSGGAPISNIANLNGMIIGDGPPKKQNIKYDDTSSSSVSTSNYTESLLNGLNTTETVGGARDGEGDEKVQPVRVQPDIVPPVVVQPDIVQPVVVQPDIVPPVVVPPVVVQPDIVQPDIVQPVVVQPDIVQPDIVQPDIVQPVVVQPKITVNDSDPIFMSLVEKKMVIPGKTLYKKLHDSNIKQINSQLDEMNEEIYALKKKLFLI